MNIEQINYLNEYRKATYSKLDIEKKNKIRKDARDKYHLVKAYYSIILRVKFSHKKVYK